MKKKESRKDRRMKELIEKLLGYELSRLPDEEALRKKYRLSDLFYHKMDALIQRQKEFLGNSGKRK